VIVGLLLSSAAQAQKFDVTPVAEKKVSQLPPGPLFWRVDSFPSLAKAEAVVSPTALAAEVGGKAWLVTLGPAGGSSPGGTKVAEIGPVPSFTAPEYLLRLVQSGGPPGAKTPVHTHPGSETFYVLSGELTQKTPEGVHDISAGQSMPGHPPNTPMQVSSTGTSDLSALVMFVNDATKPFSSPATFVQSVEQREPTPEEINRIEALVTKAAALIESKGEEAAFAEFGKRNSEWWHGDTYLFAYDMNGNVLLNPAAPSRVGTNPTGEKDANGKAFHQALIEMGRVNGSGWVDYLIARPGKPEPSPKWSYVRAVKFDGVPGVIGAGFYLD
jgi:quercetin dioxygenase-like cupin family protein